MALSTEQKAAITSQVAAAQAAFDALNLDNVPADQVNAQVMAARVIFVIDWLLANTNLTLNE